MDFEAPDWRVSHSSAARRKRFAFCPVGYYLHHVPGRDGYAAPPGSWRRALYEAKFRIPCAVWVKSVWTRSLRDFYRMGGNPRRWTLKALAQRLLDREMGMLERGEYRADPKLAPAILELENRIYSAEQLYTRAGGLLGDMLNRWENSDYPRRLNGVAPLDFRLDEPYWLWQLGGVNFLLAPVLVWVADRRLQILDCTGYDFEQEQLRTADLYRVYGWRFLGIEPAAVAVEFYDPQLGTARAGTESGADFAVMFRQLSGEAAMWRDYLVRQYDAAASGLWRYARFDHCGACRFMEICPARDGTPEPERTLQ